MDEYEGHSTLVNRALDYDQEELRGQDIHATTHQNDTVGLLT